MNQTEARSLAVTAGGHRLNAAWLGPGPADAPTLVFLHEGLGSIGQWRDVPAALAAATGCGALVYDRHGYGGSAPLAPPYRRTADFMHREGRVVLPELLDRLTIARTVLVGHSDGASIALIAAATGDARILGVISVAAHVFVETVTLASIRGAVAAWRDGDLRARLARYHGAAVDSAFLGWANIWLDESFAGFDITAELARVTCPVLAIQGRDDPYGSDAQLDAIAAGVAGPVECLALAGCGHAPHHEQRAAVLAAAAAFVARHLVAPPST